MSQRCSERRWLAGASLHVLARFPRPDATNNFRLYDAGLVCPAGIDSASGFEVALELTAKVFARGEPITEVLTIWRDAVAGRLPFRLFCWLPRYLYWYGVALTRGKIFGWRAK
ncbi:MAG TPA: hypothetical protein VI542_08795 [Candidatus Tectomicrobia bacterium]